MPYTPVAVDQFEGVDLLNDTSEGGPSRCVDALNLERPPGRIKTRDGYDNFTSSAAALRVTGLTAYYGSARHLIAAVDDDLVAYNTSGAVVATFSGGGGVAGTRGVVFGTPTATYLYQYSGASGTARWDGAAWTTPAGVKDAVYYAVQSPDNRLVAAYTDAGGGHEVAFSNAGDAETFTAADKVQITPGDGQTISGAVSWGNLVFVTKQTKFAVFYGNSTDTTGGSIFNYRVVDTGVGAGMSGNAQQRVICAGRPGVFFLNRRGVYLTTGDEPRLISRPLDPLFLGTLPDTYPGSAINQAQFGLADICWMGERLFVALPTGSSAFNDRLFVWDSITDRWTIWDIPAAGLAAFQQGNQEELHFSYATGSNHIGRQSSSFTTDDGAAISWRWQSGWWDLGTPGQEKVTRYSSLLGTGTATLQVGVDYGSVDTGSAVTLGTSPAVDEGFQDLDRAGVLFSHKISGTGQATINRLTHYVSHVRPPGLRST